ncbi:MAG: nitroreductase family protein [Deltaproteobacteria bacterium]|nr:nitroreductase family protein [Deltaproteobacteria bacterium]
MAEAGLFDIMYSTRSMRKLKTDPVPDAVLHQILEAATRAPSGTNTQHWRFLVVKDPAVKKQVQALYQKGWGEAKAMYDNRPGPEHMSQNQFGRLLDAATHLAEHMAEAPVLIFACLKERPLPPQFAARLGRLAGSSIYPAVQNILLTCRALGLGATLTTVASLHEDELKQVLGLPAEVNTYALIPIGYPLGKFGPVKRLPVEEVTCLDKWGQVFKQ